MPLPDEKALMPIEATRVEVSAQPEVVARVLQKLQEQTQELAQTLARRQVNLVLASGSGDSWFAAQAVRLAWERYAGVPFEALQAYEYAAYGRPGVDDRTLHLVISSSGRPTTTWDALDRALNSPAYVVGITDKTATDNPFIIKPSVVLVPGAVKVGWPTQTTTATIAVLLNLAVAFGQARGYLNDSEAACLFRQLNDLPSLMTEVLDRSIPWVEMMAPTLSHQRIYTFVGGGPSFAVAQNGAALMAEGPQEVGQALMVEEFHHALRVATLQKGDPVLLIAPVGESEMRIRDTARVVKGWGARLIVLVTPGTDDLIESPEDGFYLPEVEEPFSPLLTLLPLHALSIALAESKVTGGYQRPESVPK